MSCILRIGRIATVAAVAAALTASTVAPAYASEPKVAAQLMSTVAVNLTGLTPLPTARYYSVTPHLKKYYRSLGGLKGMGRATAKAKCNTRAGGCFQRFQKGTIYVPKNKRNPKMSRVRGARGEILVLARNQLGYGVAKGTRTKYQRWLNTSNAWCGILQEWFFHASGNGKYIPKFNRFANERAWIKKNWKKRARPRNGTIVIMNSSGYHTHMALVSSAGRNRISIIEGNWGRQAVTSRTIPILPSMGFYEPRW